jgi:choline kinase
MRAIILSAGQGSRLLPLTADRPKCLVPLGRRSFIEWQVRQLEAGGVREIVVVTGFRADMVEAELARLAHQGLDIRTVYNPFYGVADNLGSCWLARAEMDRDFIVLNGDTLFESAVLERLLASPPAPITVTIDKKPRYDADDMKVRLDGIRLVDIGKTLPPEESHAESIGLLLFRGEGPRAFAAATDRAMRGPEGLKWWYLRVIGQLARQNIVSTLSIEGLEWGEMDYPQDLERLQALAERWAKQRRVAPALRNGG